MPDKPQKFGKADAMTHWEDLPDGGPIRLTPIEAKHEGTAFAQDTIRLTGSREFIDSVLGNLKGYLEWEGDSSRIEIAYMQTRNRTWNEDGTVTMGDLTGSWACYVKVRSRGRGKPGRIKGSRNRERGPDEPIPMRKPRADKSDPEPTTYSEPDHATITPGEPLYAVAQGFLDENGNVDPIWVEPIGDHPILEMQTYETLPDCGEAIDRLKKNKAFAKAKLEIVQVDISKKGKLTCTQV